MGEPGVRVWVPRRCEACGERTGGSESISMLDPGKPTRVWHTSCWDCSTQGHSVMPPRRGTGWRRWQTRHQCVSCGFRARVALEY